MKKTLALILAVLMVVALFVGCGPKESNPSTPDSGSNTSSGSDSSTVNQGGDTTEASVEEDSPYNFAAGKFKADENGFALEKYEYTEPLTPTDETLSFWTICWTPTLTPASGNWNDLGYAQGQEDATGVHIEYVITDGATRNENFSVLLAADDLCDLSVSGAFFYSGTIKEAVYDEA